MRISEIKDQEKRKDRVSVYVDGEYCFSLSKWQLKEIGLSVGDEISNDDIDEYLAESDLGKIYEQTLKWLSLRSRSEWEIDTYLFKKTKHKSQREDIKQRIDKLGQLDDKKFAEAWVSSRRSLRLTSKQRIKQELLQKRVDKDIINQVLEEDETDELQVVKELIAKKRRQTKYQDEEKLLGYLSRQGFNYGTIKDALQSMREE